MMTLIQPFQPNPKLPCKNAKKGENDKKNGAGEGIRTPEPLRDEVS